MRAQNPWLYLTYIYCSTVPALAISQKGLPACHKNVPLTRRFPDPTEVHERYLKIAGWLLVPARLVLLDEGGEGATHQKEGPPVSRGLDTHTSRG
jgi:hypothetical protein